VLHEGYVREDSRGDRVGSSVTLITDGDRVIVVDPGMVSGREALLAALAAAGPGPDDVTDVVFSHHHPDHTVNAALFPRATIHDHWASYQGDLWMARDPGDFQLAPSVRLIATPGHTAEDITTLAATPDGVYAGHRPDRAGPQPPPHPGRGHGHRPRPRPGVPAARGLRVRRRRL